MKKRMLIKFAALLLSLCLLLSACGGNPDALTDEEWQTAIDVEIEAGLELTEAATPEQVPEPVSEIRQSITVTIDSTERLLYRDDTKIVYTVETPSDCTEVIMSLIFYNYSTVLQMKDFKQQERQLFEETDRAVLWAYNMPLKQQSLTPQSEGVTVEEKEDALVWTIPCDFGFTGAERIAAEAVCPGDNGMHPFGIVNVDIHYPVYNTVDEVELAIRAAIEYNKD